jgi:hypothetical protein
MVKLSYYTDEEPVLILMNEARQDEDVILVGVTLTERVSSALIRVLEQGRAKRSLLGIHTCFHNSHLDAVLETAMRLDVFTNLEISTAIQSSTAFETIQRAMQHNHNLQRVSFTNMTISQDHVAILRDGLIASQGLLKNLEFCGVRFPDDDGIVDIASGIARNQSLKSVGFVSCSLEDSQTAKIVNALTGHHSISELHLDGTSCGPQSMQAIRQVLTTPSCKLQVLGLSNHFEPFIPLDLNSLLHGLKNARSLRKLDLSDNQLVIDDLRGLMNNLWRFPNIEILDLSKNCIQKLDGIHESKLSNGNAPAKLRRIDLSFNPIGTSSTVEEDDRWLQKILETNPNLTDLGNGLWEQSFPRIQHLLDWNAKARPLIGNYSVSPSVWSLALERVNRSLQENRQANTIYHMVHGLASMGLTSTAS